MPSDPTGTRPDTREIELKLTLPADQIDAIGRHPLVAGRTAGEPSQRRLSSVYFDTPGLRLAECGIALRVRRAGTTFVQTVKTRGEARGGLFERLELEAPIAAEHPDLGAIADPKLRAEIEALHHELGLAPVVETEFRRTSRRLVWDDTEVLCELDEGEVRTARGSTPIAELELELVRGDKTALFDFALALSGSIDLRPAREGKVDRGFALLRDELPQAMRAPKLDHPEGATLGAVIGRIVGSALEQLQANEDIARAGLDPEGVHQMRVALRRLRAAFTTFRDVLPRASLAPLRGEARWLARELGFVRDLDVFLGETLIPLCARFSDDGGLKRLRESTQTLRDASYDGLREQLDSRRYAEFVLRLARWVVAEGWCDQPLSPQGARLYRDARAESRGFLRPLHRKAHKLGSRLSSSGHEEKHALRIQLKKLRYGAEFLTSLYDRKAGRRYAARLAALQDVLGQLNDVATARRLLELLGEWMGEKAPADVHRATGLVEGWIARGSDDALRDLDVLWRRFEKTPPFWD